MNKSYKEFLFLHNVLSKSKHFLKTPKSIKVIVKLHVVMVAKDAIAKPNKKLSYKDYKKSNFARNK